MKSKYVKRPLTIQKHGALDSFIVHLTFGSHWTKILASLFEAQLALNIIQINYHDNLQFLFTDHLGLVPIRLSKTQPTVLKING